MLICLGKNLEEKIKILDFSFYIASYFLQLSSQKEKTF
jgi:hypothetical protein